MYIDYGNIFQANSPVEHYPKKSERVFKFHFAHSIILKDVYFPVDNGYDDLGHYWERRVPDCYFDPGKDAFCDIETDEIATVSAQAASDGTPKFDTREQLRDYAEKIGFIRTAKAR